MEGALDEQGKSARTGKPTHYSDADTTFGLWADSPDNDKFVLDVTDWNNNRTFKTGQFTPAAGATSRTFSYDNNGNTLQMVEIDAVSTHTRNYTWDAKNQLVAIDQDNGTTRSVVPLRRSRATRPDHRKTQWRCHADPVLPLGRHAHH